MAYQPVRRFPSPQSRAASGEPDGGAVMIDGLDVVDEQVVVLSPVEPRGTTDRGGRTRPARPASRRPLVQRDGYGLG
jgi:hypothetical protein